MKRFTAVALIGLVALAAGCRQEPENRTTVFVDPFIGTDAHGHCFPGALVPFGGVQLSPDNPRAGWDWCSGYHYSDSIISSFSHTHLSGTGIGDLQDIRLLPTVLKPETGDNPLAFIESAYARFSHSHETAEPGYYSVVFDNGIRTELSATERCGIHAYQFPAGGAYGVTLDLSTARNWDRTAESYLKKVNNRTIEGYRKSTGWAKDQRVYFSMQFSQDIEILAGSDSLAPLANGEKIRGNRIYAWINFGKTTDKVLVKVGISPANIDGATANLTREIPHWSFDKVHRDAKQQWRKMLSRIRIDESDRTLARTFYTALYHCYMAPYTFSDTHGNFKGVDGEIHSHGKQTQYTVFSLWDTFRALHPLFTITQPQRVGELITSMLNHYDYCGELPNWELMGNESRCMVGNPAITVIAEAYLKGFRDFNVEKAYEAVKATALTKNTGLNLLRQYGYIPCDLLKESVSQTLEYAYNDWCVAMMAHELGHPDDSRWFLQQAANYKNLFDATSGFMRGKTADGQWRTPFNPLSSEHRNDDYTEGNAWQYSWFVPHDIPGLIDLHGGKQAFITKLDSLFTLPSVLEGNKISPDISGMIGQYAQGNEPSHHVAYMFNYADAPQKTQYYVDKIRRELYTDRPDGLCGNDDCGQLSAWYVFSSLGFYPVNPCDGKYQLGTPLFKKAVIKLPGDRRFVIKANKESDAHIYVREVRLNGTPLKRTWITHAEIMQGGELEFELTT